MSSLGIQTRRTPVIPSRQPFALPKSIPRLDSTELRFRFQTELLGLQKIIPGTMEMADSGHRNPMATHRDFSVSADFGPRTKEPSVFYSMLPSAVQSRLPRLTSLRRSVSMYGLTSRRNGAGSRPSSSTSSGSSTPNAEYANAMVLSGSRAVEEELTRYAVEPGLLDEELPQAANRKRQLMVLTESQSGIGWKFANQGIASLQSS